MINIELTETDYRRIMNALNIINEAPTRSTEDLIEKLKKSHDQFVRAKELSSAKFLVQQAYNKCKDVANSTGFVSVEESLELKEVINSLSSVMSKMDQALLFQKQVIDGGNISTGTVDIA